MQHEPSPAAGIAAALGARAEAVCRRYLPHGRKQGRYWVAGDLDGAAAARSSSASAVRAFPVSGPMQPRERTAICSISSVGAPTRRRCARRSTRPGRFSPCRLCRPQARATATTPPRRHAAYGVVPAPSTALLRNAISRRAVCRAAASRLCAFIPNFATVKVRPCAASRRWSAPSPAATGPSSACSAPGSIRAGSPRRASRPRAKRSAVSSDMRSGSGPSLPTVPLRSSSARASRPCCRW